MFKQYAIEYVADTVRQTGRELEPSMAIQRLKEIFGFNMLSAETNPYGFEVGIVVNPYETTRPHYFYFDGVLCA